MKTAQGFLNKANIWIMMHALYCNTVNGQKMDVCLSTDTNHGNSQYSWPTQSVFHLGFSHLKKNTKQII